jgi:hypothetical protein
MASASQITPRICGGGWCVGVCLIRYFNMPRKLQFKLNKQKRMCYSGIDGDAARDYGFDSQNGYQGFGPFSN